MRYVLSLHRAKNRLYFINPVYKVRTAADRIRAEMRTRSRATCPELARATGLSLVTVHKEVARLCRTGELRTSEERLCRGGRPARVYEYEARYARCVLLDIRREGALMRARLELTDLQGRTLSRRESTYAALEKESLDGVLDDTLRRQRIAGISLFFSPLGAWEPLVAHLARRYRCPVQWVNAAEALAEGREGEATLYLRRGEAPLCSYYRHGHAENAGRLDLLPLPAAWETLDYTDHTLVEEMVARLLLILTCALAPMRIVAHADFWSTRLTERIRFNAQSKLRGQAPALVFRATTAELAHNAARAYALNPARGKTDWNPPADHPHTN